jgi:glycolate oxidase FAD binding subunit
MILPQSAEELASELAGAQASNRTITLLGNNTKGRMAGPLAGADVAISTTALNRVLEYEPRDLTISVEAGMPFRELTAVLAQNRQMIPLDPPFALGATVGGVVAANTSGPRRCLYGSARDMVIGMTFATLEGKLIRTGGMVVKNVAGLDMGKLMIGSFGTLAAIVSINFKLHPMPEATRTFTRRFENIGGCMAARDSILKSPLQPAALDILKSSDGYEILVRAGGNRAVLDRHSRELTSWEALEGGAEEQCWRTIQEFIPEFLANHPNGAVARISAALRDVGTTLESLPAPALARAATGVCYGCVAEARDALGRGVIEFAPDEFRHKAELWPAPGSDFAMMEKVKLMFDPRRLLNRGRLYGRL